MNYKGDIFVFHDRAFLGTVLQRRHCYRHDSRTSSSYLNGSSFCNLLRSLSAISVLVSEKSNYSNMAFVSSSIVVLPFGAMRNSLFCIARPKFPNFHRTINSSRISAQIKNRYHNSDSHSDGPKIPSSLEAVQLQLDAQMHESYMHTSYKPTSENPSNTTPTHASSNANDHNASQHKRPQSKAHNVPLQRICIAIPYISFLFFLAQHIPEILSSEQLHHLLKGEIDHVNSALFSMTLFVLMSVFNFTILFNAGASAQPKWLPTKLFTIVFNIAGIIPYLCLRSTAESEPQSDVLNRFIDGRILPLLCTIVNMALYAYPLGLFSPLHGMWLDLSVSSQLLQIGQIVQCDPFASMVSLMFWGLSVAVADPLLEDMEREGWFTEEKKLGSSLVALVVCMLPVLGPSMYLLFRAKLRPSSSTTKTEKSALDDDDNSYI